MNKFHFPFSTFQKAHGPILSDADLKAAWGDLIQPGMIGFGTKTVSACMGDSGKYWTKCQVVDISWMQVLDVCWVLVRNG